MHEIKVETLNASNEKLVGIKTIPDAMSKKLSAVILVHGFGVTKEEYGFFPELSRQLVNKNILSFRFDFSGCGESEGDYINTSMTKLKSDLNTILEYVKNDQSVDKNNIGMLGCSLGCPTVVTLHPQLKAFVLVSPVVHLKDVISSLFKKNEGYLPNGISTRIKADGRIIKVKPNFWKDMNNYNILDLIKKVSAPLLIIHGDSDESVPLSETENLYKQANNPKEKYIISGGKHGSDLNGTEANKIIVDWFANHLFE